MSIYREFKPTYLYIKQHTVTGKLYFGKTTRNHKSLLAYTGGGTIWKRHIRKHGKEYVETLWYCLFYDEASIKEFALMCSEQWNIVESESWANLIVENGLNGTAVGHPGGMKGKKHSKETRKLMSESAGRGKNHHSFGLKHSEETKLNMSINRTGENNAMFGKKHSEVTRAKFSKDRTGKHLSEEHCKAISVSLTGVIRGPYLNGRHPRGKQKNPAPKVICPHCLLIGSSFGMTRFHFDNCKLKPD